MDLSVTLWNEHRVENKKPEASRIYPDGIGACIAEGLARHEIAPTLTRLDAPDQGLPQPLLDATSVLLWWGHLAHEELSDETIARVQNRVLQGMGLVVLHSGHHSKIFRRLMGTSCNLAWRDAKGGERERVWCLRPSHPIAEGLPPCFEIDRDEMYGEPFDIPEPDELVFVSWFQGGEVFRSGCTFVRGRGRIFYFSPGHETFPVYKNEHVIRAIANGIRWAHQRHSDGRNLQNWNRPVPDEPGAPRQTRRVNGGD